MQVAQFFFEQSGLLAKAISLFANRVATTFKFDEGKPQTGLVRKPPMAFKVIHIRVCL